MLSVFNRYATPFITGLFLVSLVSGLALFFHVGPMGFHGMHEWLSLVLILPFGLHVWKNWRPMKLYLTRAPMAIAVALSLAMAAVFLWPTSDGAAGAPAPFVLARQVLAHPVAKIAPVLDMTPEELTLRLQAAGVALAGPDQRVADAILASGQAEMTVMAAMLGGAE